ncbi:DUF4352 domain-containing protein [Salipaludibacillus sp. CUR1]|uniref:DUF4352 domain-containing protein n=1 Tax=Salipaludibacillus sp. CUR1 TaxID=2820003 RepID=UPI001E5E8D6C|nr:DUF4352 domain-containing protein [Salipaludibacillus sp. CUR1]MCE7794026.1 DUF4352 domain-containing protein [Salipaludibacillus sp. CUR1]
MKKYLLATVLVSVMVLGACDTENTTVEEVQADNKEANDVNQEANNEKEANKEETGNNVNEADEKEDAKEEFGTRHNPVEHKKAVTINEENWLFGEATYEMELIESVSGEEAEQMVADGNQFNDESGEGKEYILAKFRVQLEYAEEEPFDVNPQQFDVISSGGSSYEEFISISGLEPEFRSDLYEGGEVEGWVPFLINEEDEKPLVKYGDVWFDLRGE